MKKKAIYLYVCWLISAFGALLSLWDLLAGKRLENPAEVMQLKGKVAQQYNRFYDAVFDLNHSMNQVLILFVGLLLLATVLVLLIKKKLLLANILYSAYSVFTILVMAYDYLSSQPLYHYFSDPAIRESIMMIPKAVTIVGLLLNTFFLAIILFNIYGKKIVGIIPVLLGLIVGYIFSLILGAVTGQEIVSFAKVGEASWLHLPPMSMPFLDYDVKFYPSAILTMAPIAFVTMTEHFGHVMVLNSLTGKDFFKDPGLDKTLTGDGLAQIIAGLFGAPPVTSYGENIGVMALNKIYSVYVIAGAAVLAIVMSFVGKVSALLQSIPSPVLGGISIALFGVIASSGLKILIEAQTNFDNKKNLLIASVILVSGIGGLTLQLSGLQISGVALSTILGIVLYLVLPEPKD